MRGVESSKITSRKIESIMLTASEDAT